MRPLVLDVPFTPFVEKWALSEPSDFFDSRVSERFTRLMGCAPLRSSDSFRRSSDLSRVAAPFVRDEPGFSGLGVAGTLLNEYVPVRLRLAPGTFASGAPVLLYGMSLCREYGKSGRTAVMRFAEAVLQAEMQINCSGIRGVRDERHPDAQVP